MLSLLTTRLVGLLCVRHPARLLVPTLYIIKIFSTLFAREARAVCVCVGSRLERFCTVEEDKSVVCVPVVRASDFAPLPSPRLSVSLVHVCAPEKKYEMQ